MKMIALDPYLIDFMKNNWLTLSFIFAILKGIATVTPWSADNKIIEAIWGAITSLRGGGNK